ncbi:MAG: hypothetical protein OXP08_03195 [bacterium]|nr:hypothetical protein [bacterium]
MKNKVKTLRRVAVGATAALGVLEVAFVDLGWSTPAMLIGLAIAVGAATEEGIDAASGA